MPDEYILKIGTEITSVLTDVKDMKAQILQLQGVSKQLTDSMQTGFTAVSNTQVQATKNVVEGTKAIQQQSGVGQELAQVYQALATAAARASDSAPIKKYAAEFQKLADLAGKTTSFGIVFDDADLITLAGSIDETKGQMAGLIAVTDLLKTKLTSLDPNSDEFKLLSEQITTADSIIKEFNGEVENTHGKLKTTRTELLAMKEELVRMDEAGQGGTKAFQDLSIAAAKLQNTIRESADRVRVLASNTKYIDATIEGLRAVTAGFGLAEGATALFGSENKELAETLKKVQGAMLILQSLQEIQTLINKASALSVLTTKAAHAANTVAITAETGATGIQTGALIAETGATEAATVATKGFWATLLATPVGLVLAAIGAIIGIFSSFKSAAEEAPEAQNKFNESLETQFGVNDEFLKGLKDAGDKRIAEMRKQGKSEQEIRDEELKNIQAQLDQTNSVIKAQEPAANAAYDQLRKIIDKNTDDITDKFKLINPAGGFVVNKLLGIPSDKDNAELATSLDKTVKTFGEFQKKRNDLQQEFDLKKLANDDAARKEDEAAAKKRADEDDKAYQKRLQLEAAYQKALLDIKRQYRDVSTELIVSDRERDIQLAANKYRDDINAIQALLDEQKKAGQSSAELTQAAEDAKAAIKKKYTNSVLKIDADFYTAQQNALIAANQVINSVTETKEQSDIDAANKRFDDLIKDLNAKSAQISAQQGVLSEKDFALISAYSNAVIDANEAREIVIANIKRDAALQSLNTQKDLAISTVEALKVSGISEEDLTKLISEKKLDIQKEYAQKQLDLIGKNLIDTKKITQKQLDDLLNPANLQAAGAQGVSIFDFLNLNTNIDDETKKKILDLLSALNVEVKVAAKEKFNLTNYIADALFGKDGRGRDFTKEFASIAGDLFAQLTQAMEADAQRQVDAIGKVIDALNDQISTQEDIVKRQQELSDKGLANDLAAEQKKLDQLNANKAAEVAAQEAAQQKLEKIRKQEAILQAAAIITTNIETAANLQLAVAKLLGTSAGLPFGIIIGIGYAALLLSTYLSIKNAIQASAQSAPTLEKGGGMQLQGKPHTQGGIGLYDGHKKIAEFEGDEYLNVINKRSTKKYLPLLQAINQDDIPSMKKYLSGILGGSRMPANAMRETLELMHDSEDAEIEKNNVRDKLYRSLINNSKSKSERNSSIKVLKDANLESIDENIKELVAIHKKPKKEVVDMGDHVIETEGNRTRKIRKKVVQK